MRADFSRLSFDRPEAVARHYAGVLHQQGRVWLDSDWNEDVLTRLHLLEREARDLIGACGVPDPGTAFQILPNPDPNSQPDDFLIAGGPGPRGHYYVDGILAQLERTTSYLRQPDLPAPPRFFPDSPASHLLGGDLVALVYLEVWRRLITDLEDESLREVALGGVDTTVRIKTLAQVKMVPLPDGKLPPTCAASSKLLPGPGRGTMTTLPPQDTLPPDQCSLPDPANYTGRENHLYRVEIHDAGDVFGASSGSASNTALGADAAQGALTLTLATPLDSSQIDAVDRAGVINISDDDGKMEVMPLTDVSADGLTLGLGRGLKQAFTTARHAVVVGGVARFKWSRDNAAFAVAVTAVSDDRRTLTLSSLGRDQATALRKGDLVEVSDDSSDLGPGRGHLTLLSADPDPDLFTVALEFGLPAGLGAAGVSPPSPPTSPLSPPAPSPQASPHLVLRRWDGWGWAGAKFDELATPDMDLGDGVHIQFGGSDLKTGDYWAFTARSADGSVEALEDAPPLGIIRHRCPLAVVRWSLGQGRRPTFEVLEDCRPKFPSLTRLRHLYYVSGDGQEAPAGQSLPQPLQVGVANGPWPVAQAKVRFRVTAGGGMLLGGTLTASDLIVPTGADGVAECLWRLDDETASQRVEATLVSGSSLPVRFNAGFTDERHPGAHIEGLFLGDPEDPAGRLRNDSDVPASLLARGGITAVCDAPIEPATVSRPTCFLTIEIPVPLSNLAPAGIAFTLALFAYQTLTLEADVGAKERFIFWRPTKQTAALLERLATFKRPTDRGILARLTIKGDFVWSAKDPTFYLDGDAFGIRREDGSQIDLLLPSGDGVRGGDFAMWFWLIPAAQLLSLELRPNVVIGGGPVQGIINLTGAAPGDVAVQLASSNTSVAQLPGAFTIAAGETSSQPFPIKTLAAKGSSTISATLDGTTVSADLTVVVLDTFTILNPSFPQPTPVTGPGGTMTGTVTLSAAAPQRVSVDLTVSSDPRQVVKSIPRSVIIDINQASATFAVTTNTNAIGSVDVTAVLGDTKLAARFSTSG